MPHLKAAGIGETDDGRLFYKRDYVSKLLQFLDDATGLYGFIDGLPGTGKSSTIWYKILCLVTERKATVTWMHFNRWGIIEKHAKLHYGQSGLVIEKLKNFLPTALGDKIMEVDTGILVLDGVNQPMFAGIVAAAQLWKDEDQAKTVYLSMSNKIERLHPHEEKAFGEGKRMYCTQHSWTLDEFKEAFIDEDGRRSRLFIENVGIFEMEWEIEEDDPSQELERRENVTGQAARSSLLSLRLFARNMLYVEDQLGGCSNSQDRRLKIPLHYILTLLSLNQQFSPLTWGRGRPWRKPTCTFLPRTLVQVARQVPCTLL